ncbi:MAG: pentapeptide repeat-containing protein [Terracidiphilus sp.]
MGIEVWNGWRARHPELDADLTGADLSRMDLSEADLARAFLTQADLTGAILRWANLRRANLNRARLADADLSGADLTWATLEGAALPGAALNGAKLVEARLAGALLPRAVLWEADLSRAHLEGADLGSAYLSKANFCDATLTGANLAEANLSGANLRDADLDGTHLNDANLAGADLIRADLAQSNLEKANLRNANLAEASIFRGNLSNAVLSMADMNHANLRRANLSAADLRSANLQRANLDGANLTNARLWETQRAGWSIQGVLCACAYWDEDARVPTHYAPGEFERLYSEQTCIELFYHGGVSTFELNTLPALLYHLASLHPDSNIRLKSIEETGGGAKISISVGDASTESAEKIKADAMQVYHAQLALRDKKTERLQIEKDYLERLFLGKLVPAMLSAGTPHNVFNAPVTGVVIASGESNVDFHQTVNDNSALLALLEKMMDCRADLNLSTADARKFETELQSTTAELQKQNPDKSIVSRGVHLIRTFAEEAFKSAAGKLGEQAVSADWQSWLHQLGHFISHLN